MARKVFHSFRYEYDHWRVQQIKQMGVIDDGQPLLNSNEWEQIKRGGADAIQRWIDNQMKGKSCQIVLIGQATAGREWVNYEIGKAWRESKGTFGIYVHNLKDENGKQAAKGQNPFDDFTIGSYRMSSVVRSYDPPYTTSTNVYEYIKANIAEWVEEAIQIRKDFS